MATRRNDTPRWSAISDLNWARLTAWRALLAGFYDVAENRSHLDRLDFVVIEYAPSTVDPSAIPPVFAARLVAGQPAGLASSSGFREERTNETTSFEFRRIPMRSPSSSFGRHARSNRAT